MTPSIRDIDKLQELKRIYGDRVYCTDGLFFIAGENREETYIFRNTGRIDNRVKYQTIEILDNIVIAKTLGENTKYIVIDKMTLKYLFWTHGIIKAINKNIIYSLYNNNLALISHNGKLLTRLKNVSYIEEVNSLIYLIKSSSAYNDKLIVYSDRHDDILDLTYNKNYNIVKIDSDTIEVAKLQGMKYTYKISSREFRNAFTDEVEPDTQIWSLIQNKK